jgi:hypothetical protein
MSDRRTDRDVDQTLDAWMSAVAPPRAPARLLEGTFAETMRSRQKRAFPWHRIARGRLWPASRSSGRFVAVLLAGLLLRMGVEWHVWQQPFHATPAHLAEPVTEGLHPWLAQLLSIIFSLNLILAVNTVGPFVVMLVGRLVARFAPTAPVLLAARRIVEDPRSTWRAVGALGLAIIIVGFTNVVSAAERQPGTPIIFA